MPSSPASSHETDASHSPETSPSPAWKPVTRASTHELVINAIEEQITSGTLTVGDPLPSERDLAAKLQVSRAAVREALRVMESLGVVVSNVGSGRSAGTFIASMPKEALTRFLRLHVALTNFSIDETIETRIQLERSSTALATTRAHDDALAGMNASLAIMDTPGVSLETFNDADTAFHVAIAHASDNQLLSDLTGAIRDSLRRPILDAFHEVDDPRALMARLQEQHHGIMHAIVDRNTELAVQLTEDHIRAATAALPTLTDSQPPPR